MKLTEFWQRMSIDERGCWIWQGAKASIGYGHLRWNGRTEYAHRLAFTLTHGEIPPDKWVLHACDNPSCANPEHLFLGSPKDNTEDSIRKGRWNSASRQASRYRPPCGADNPLANMTSEQVAEIRRLKLGGMRQADIARRFGISENKVSQIVLYKRYKEK